MINLKIFVSHPIPYFVPLWRELNKSQDIDLLVCFFSRGNTVTEFNKAFNRKIKWDGDLLNGYKYTFIKEFSNSDTGSQMLDLRAKKLITPEYTDVLLVHGYIDRFSRQAIRLSKKNGILTLMRGPITYKTRPSQLLIKKAIRYVYLKFYFFRLIDIFLYIGRSSYKEYKRLGVPSKKLFYSPYTIDYDNLERQKSFYTREQERLALNISPSSFVILIVGVINKRKNHKSLLKAIELSPFKENFHLLVIGDGALLEEVKQESSKILCAGVTFTGFVNQTKLGKYYLAADLFVFPSFYDSWGLVLNEAIQFGLPAIVSNNVSSGDDLIHDGLNGYIFDPLDFIDLSKKIDNIYLDSNSADRMSQVSLHTARNYQPKLAAKSIEDAIKIKLDKK